MFEQTIEAELALKRDKLSTYALWNAWYCGGSGSLDDLQVWSKGEEVDHSSEQHSVKSDREVVLSIIRSTLQVFMNTTLCVLNLCVNAYSTCVRMHTPISRAPVYSYCVHGSVLIQSPHPGRIRIIGRS